ncbi:HpcH/HpaI aldolase family protein [Variovorax sp. PBL-E5]|uniref:HpcH/HpaI aldolase family protein n=1 Tax=Variovorax sp. PBL-E5 TaxID=434014 RepID=UPI001316EC83|nr:aldolase/citrate lyase family protein [Variovorax sp. PBL-E5]VTU25280.1 4-hydroxy-2-oxo-heptane-1,7-dioate aldolase [Variovorax sp. PBL-E5]
MKPSPLRCAIDDGRPAIGMFVMMDGGASARLLAHLGYDFVVFDLQHGAIDLAGIEAVLGGVKGTECAPIARVHPRRPDQIEWALDLGAHGVVVPMVNSAADARLAVDACRYAPQGRRSVAALRNVLQRGNGYMTKANDDVVCIIQIEHIEAVERIDEILAVKGIDAVMPGHVDLALSMGHTLSYGGSVSNTVPQEVTDAIARVESACAARGLPVIPVAGTPQEFARAQQRGQRIACCNTDFHLFLQAAGAQLQACRAAMNHPTPGDKT